MTGLDIATALGVRDQRVRPGTELLLAWVTAVGSTTVALTLVDGQTVSGVPKLRAYSALVDDMVVVLKASGSLYVLGALNAAPTPPPEPDEDDKPPAPTVRTRTFRPNFTGVYYHGSWRAGNLAQGNKAGPGDMRYGGAYYGNGPSGLSGSAVSGTVRIKRVSEGRDGYKVAPTLRLLNAKNRPGGMPGYSRSFRGPAMKLGETRTVSLPTSWVSALIAGNAGGIGIGIENTTPHVALAGRGAWGPSMELTLKYKR